MDWIESKVPDLTGLTLAELLQLPEDQVAAWLNVLRADDTGDGC
jgi:hypothetical protein